MAENTLTIEFKDSDPPKAVGAGSAASTTAQLQPATANVASPAGAGAGIPVTSSSVRGGDVKAVPVRIVPDGAAFEAMAGESRAPEPARQPEQVPAQPERAQPEPQDVPTLKSIAKATPLEPLPQARPASDEAKRERDRNHAQWLRDRDAEDAFDAGEAAKMKAEKEAKQAASMAKMRTAGSAAQSAANGDYLSAGLQAASTGALGEEAAMFAAGPEGALLAVAKTLYDSMQAIAAKPFEMAREGLAQAGKTGEDIAGGDLKSVTSDYVEAVSGFAEKTGLAGVVVGEFIKTEWAAVNALNQVTDAFVKRGKELSKYNGGLAEANAQADVRRLLADIRESEKLGPELARLTKSSSEIEALQTELMLFLKGELVSALLEIVEPIGDIAKSIKPILKEILGISGEVKVLAGIVKVTPAVRVLKMINLVIEAIEYWLPWLQEASASEPSTLIDGLIDMARRAMDGNNTNVTVPSQRQEPWPQGPTWGGRRNA